MADHAQPGDRQQQGLTAAATIFALSSGQLPAGIAVVRISGPDALDALMTLTAKPCPEPRYATLATLRSRDGGTLDRGIVLWFPTPASATGEDVVELHLHGGRAVVAAVSAALEAMPGLRPAEPGEFTRRAFENGRIDYAEAEALGDLLRAETEAQRRNAIGQLEGGLARLVAAWQARLVALSAGIEALVDHSDEADVDETVLPALISGAVSLGQDIEDALGHPPAERLHEGVRIVIAGRPNAGKSSLINALSGRDVAIVSTDAGTTRDLIEVPQIWDGMPLILTDTAGLREDPDSHVETIGIARARSVAAAADIVVALDDSVVIAPNVVVVAAKSDLGGAGAGLCVSALTGEGVSTLRSHLVARMRGLLPPLDRVALNARHRSALRDAVWALADAARQSDIILQAESLRIARMALDRVTGCGGTEDMLDALFGQFCIGK